MPKLMRGFIQLQEGEAQRVFPAISWSSPERIALGLQPIVRDRTVLAACTDGPDGLKVLYATANEPLSLRVGVVRGARLEDFSEATFGHPWLANRERLLMDAIANMAGKRWEEWRRAARGAELEARKIMAPIMANLRTPEA